MHEGILRRLTHPVKLREAAIDGDQQGLPRLAHRDQCVPHRQFDQRLAVFEIVFMDKNTVQGNPTTLDDEARFQDPKGAQGGPIHGKADLGQLLRQMRKERGASCPCRYLLILQESMRFFELAAKTVVYL